MWGAPAHWCHTNTFRRENTEKLATVRGVGCLVEAESVPQVRERRRWDGETRRWQGITVWTNLKGERGDIFLPGLSAPRCSLRSWWSCHCPPRMAAGDPGAILRWPTWRGLAERFIFSEVDVVCMGSVETMSVAERDQVRISIQPAHGMKGAPLQGPPPPGWGARRRLWIVPGILVAAVVLLVFAWKILMGERATSSDALVYYTLRRGALPITVVERGNLESQKTEEVTCEVENLGGDRYGTTGTQILFIVPNGSSVKKGDLLVELDSAPLQERLDSQFLSLQRAEAEMIQANSRYDNQITQNETNLAEAELEVKLARLDLESYFNEAEEGAGTYEIELQNIQMLIQTARASQMIAETDWDAMEELYRLGYKSRGDREQARLKLMEANSEVAGQMARAHQLRTYTFKAETLTRQGKLDTAERNLDQVGRNNAAELAQAEAARDSANEAYKKEKERFDRYQEQMEKCKIYAPQDGMVAYAMEEGRRGGGSVIGEGAFVRQRQIILTIPDLSRMQVKTAVHESVLDQVDTTKSAVIRVDAFADRSYTGKVKSVAVLPDQGGWLASDTKVYTTVVTIDEQVEQLKPGMTAVVEIDIETLQDVLSVPIQAIVQRGRTSWCYVNDRGNVARREVVLGKTNDKFVEIKQGLSEGDVVVLNPLSLLEEEQASEKEKSKAKGADAEEEGEEQKQEVDQELEFEQAPPAESPGGGPSDGNAPPPGKKGAAGPPGDGPTAGAPSTAPGGAPPASSGE